MTGASIIKKFVKAMFGISAREFYSLLPGLILSSGLAFASIRLSDFFGTELLKFEKSPISAVMTAILLGLLISNIIRLPSWVLPGITFAVKKVLRFGIILLGMRLSLVEILRLGAIGIPIVLGCIIGALFFTLLLSRIVKLPQKLGILIAVGTSICGVSAIIATGAAIDSEDDEIAYAVAVITIFGLFATIVYPYIANAIFLSNPILGGFFLGTAVHDTSQVAASALLYAEVFSQPEALNVAIVTKLIRNTFMALVIPFVTYYHNRNANYRMVVGRLSIRKFFPVFILGFLLLASVRSIGDVMLRKVGAAFWVISAQNWVSVHGFIKMWAVNLLVVALAGVGLKTRLSNLKRLGIKPFLAGLAAAATVGIIAFLLISLLGKYIKEI